MADEKPRRRTRERDERARSGDKRRPATREQPSAAQFAKRAQRELAEITGLDAEGVTSLERADDGTWTVTVDLLELARVPETDDVLGSYEAQLDEHGELLGYRRVRRYARSQAQQQGSQGSG